MRCSFVAALLLLAAAARAEYPTPQQAGFHHCALIYHVADRGPDALAPYVATDRAWLFDSFLFLTQSTPSRRATQNGQTTREDWVWQADQWFAPGRDLAALDTAIEQAAQRLAPPAKRRVMFSIPFPHPQVTDFGDVDGDGVTEDLSTPEGRAKLARWYVADLQQRFMAAGLKHLEAWGIYWMAENISGAEADTVRLFADEAHRLSWRLLWIPWYRAPGWDRWRETGIDVAILQPNYAFHFTDEGGPRRNRLAITAELARQGGLGVEIELPYDLKDPLARRAWQHYLRDGAADRWGYQQAATAHYLGGDLVEQLAASADPDVHSAYEHLVTYVTGGVVPEPDAEVAWRIGGAAAPALSDHRLTPAATGVTTAEAVLDPPRAVGEVAVHLDEPADAWQGLVRVDTREPGGDWRPAGWAVRGKARESDGRWQVVTVPLVGTAAGVRVTLETQAGAPQVAEIELAPLRGGTRPRTLAWRRGYTVTPAPPATYPDSGGELTDGDLAPGGFSSGTSVGWYGRPVTVSFDLGRVVELTAAEVYLEGGGGAAVNWPADAILMTAVDTPPAGGSTGYGAAPTGFQAPGPVEEVHRRNDLSRDGRLPFRFAQPTSARFITLRFTPQAWLMLSEIRLLAGEENVAAGRPYRLTPWPTASGDTARYADDGRKLTDGYVTERFEPPAIVGWNDRQPHSLELDLGERQPVTTVTVWSLAGGKFGITAPESVTAEVSDDATTWRAAGTALRPDVTEDGQTADACAYRLAVPAGTQARYVRLTVQPGAGWAMVSEVEVE